MNKIASPEAKLDAPAGSWETPPVNGEGMENKRATFSKRYQNALLTYLEGGRQASTEPASGLAGLASAAGLQTLDLANLHNQILLTKVLPECPAGKRTAIRKKANTFFAVAILPTDAPKKPQGIGKGKPSQRAVELAAANLELSREITRRQALEKTLLENKRDHARTLEKSARLQKRFRELSHRILSAQEDERKKISRELHDVIGQTLAGINIRLATLKKEAALKPKNLVRNIATTQRLVEKSADIVHRFARNLRPAVLDDLGLIPALHSAMKRFTAHSGVRARLTAVAAVEKLDANRRTVLFRVAQEALANVNRHARAAQVEITIQKLPTGFGMTIQDDGKSFDVEAALRGGHRTKRLGLIGMSERVEMVGGCFQVDSTRGKGTTITVNIPCRKTRGKKS